MAGEYLNKKLQALTEEHFKASELIRKAEKSSVPDEVSIHRMKKQKLILKDQINEIKSKLHPDIIA